MAADIDQIVDRRRLRRKLTFWRVATILALVLALGAGGYYFSLRPLESTPHVARLVIGGVIRNDRDRVEMIERIANSRAAAVIVSINSPGGTVTGSEQLYDALRRLSERKPVVAVVEGMAASGAYIAAMGCDRIFSRRNAIVGSVGVIFQFPNVHDLMKSVGISVEEIKSSPLKAAPSMFEPTSPEARAAINSLVVDSYAWFKGLVAERRNLAGTALDTVVDGRVFTGHQGLDLHLVDEIGDERAARAWLTRERGVPEALRVRTWVNRSNFSSFGWMMAGAAQLLDGLGFTAMSHLLSDMVDPAFERAQLDGLLTLWHPRPGF